MDGNRRWANTQTLSVWEGHAHGYSALKHIVDVVREEHIPHMVCYAFSTENWNRAEEEVAYLMTLLKQGLCEFSEENRKRGKNTNIRIIGERNRLSTELQQAITDTESKNSTSPELTVWIALSYGGRAEIVDAVNRAIQNNVYVDECSFGNLLWTEGMPDPDIIIRTSGEKRISNFLLWQCAYSEFFFVDTLWPDFGKSEFQSILEQYATRHRRRGH